MPPLILVVEDSPTQSLKLQLLLEAKGYRVDAVPSAELALELLNRGLPDLVLLDYHLPGLQGADLCRQIRLNLGTFGLPVLMLTADDTAEAQRIALEAGADDFLPKAARGEQLLRRVESLLRQSRQASELAALPRPLFRRPRVLLVGAGAAADATLSEALLEEGCEVQRAATGAEALAALDADGFDCVIAAVRPGDPGSADLTRRIGEDQNPDAPVLITLLEDDADAPDAGAQDHVSAGAEFTLLRARLRAVLRRRFLQQQQRRIAEAVREQELERLRLRAETAAAAARAALAEKLERANQNLEGALHRLAAQARITRTLTDNITSGLFMIDAVGRPTFMNPAAEQMTGYTLQEISDRPLWSLFTRGALDGSLPDAPVRERSGELRRRDGTVFPVAWSLAPLPREGDAAGTGAVAEIVDVTERKRAEQLQLMLMAELSHRVKNTLATVLSIANQTMLRHPDPQEFKAVFNGRIRALAATHNLLATTNWTAVPLAQVAAGELAPYADADGGRVGLTGPEVLIRPKAALVLGMVFHELATNAAKYGAFTTPEGRVAVSWRREGPAPESRVVIDWRESGGPTVEVPSRKGLGRTLIEGGIAYELGGRARLDFRESGLHCVIDVPYSELDPSVVPELGPEPVI
ncbi:response regulator [Arenibaculum pallidiluteum]|uniref:response regulator n=1 Tax=Arenibaculum pallidiluteum TaxID=2812559 RepID=UPI001A9712BB|nr:response regulator [Arenibaculum pallidiluteum]